MLARERNSVSKFLGLRAGLRGRGQLAYVAGEPLPPGYVMPLLPTALGLFIRYVSTARLALPFHRLT